MSDNVVWIFKNVNKSLVEQQNEMLLSSGQGWGLGSNGTANRLKDY
ncbi:hypothetical protein [Legionella birminghamensis]|uniref:Uncharacterized protein n=1 Tax=Legionella birminghamensis TaxID=28083 RepID=A0A378JQM7_9GAMM|nr:hypothetical protein [Legionella birminghamensis]STX60955.1 Uncharacterised protein [Legionella birminghamensis]